MAKKKTAKKAVKKEEVCNSETEIARVDLDLADVYNKISETVRLIVAVNERIDRIVEAHEKCKSLKDL